MIPWCNSGEMMVVCDICLTLDWIKRRWSWLPVYQEAWWTWRGVWYYYRFSAGWTWLHVTWFWIQIFADFAFVSVSFRACLSDKLLTVKEGALQRKFFSVDAGFVTSPLKLPHASILQAAKVLKLLVCCHPSLSLLLLTPNQAEFEKSEVRNGNICPSVRSDTTI